VRNLTGNHSVDEAPQALNSKTVAAAKILIHDHLSIGAAGFGNGHHIRMRPTPAVFAVKFDRLLTVQSRYLAILSVSPVGVRLGRCDPFGIRST
jgi:hypothetical protein